MTQRPLSLQSNDNTLFCTEMCNNRCIMCCQPPSNANDIDFYLKENIKRIQTAPKDLPFICLTGGEPTLLKYKLCFLIKEIRKNLPSTNIILLTNARLFSSPSLARAISHSGEENLFVETELHSDYYSDHDLIAGSINSFHETIKGIYNLAINNIPVTIRIIVCRQNYERLINLAEFIHKNLPFVSRVVFMGMECTGYAYFNYKDIWVEPFQYQTNLEEAVIFLSSWNYDVNIYNIPLCLLTPKLYQYSRKSISDWKQYHPTICKNCVLRSNCCGLFATSKVPFTNLKPVL